MKFQKIVLVDDDATVNFINEAFLSQWEVSDQIESYTEAEKVLKLVAHECPKKQCPDLILLDLKMPIFDGFDFLEEYNRLPDDKTRNIKIIVVTSSVDPRDIKRINDLGISRYINKPISREKFLSAVN